MSISTSLRSPFWLTDRLGLTSHPTRRVFLGEIETVKHPSPSTYPEMYDGRSTIPCCREPASCGSCRFATFPTVRRGCDSNYRLSPKGSVVTGSYLLRGRGLPTALPAGYCLVLDRSNR